MPLHMDKTDPSRGHSLDYCCLQANRPGVKQYRVLLQDAYPLSSPRSQSIGLHYTLQSGRYQSLNLDFETYREVETADRQYLPAFLFVFSISFIISVQFLKN